MLAIMVENRAAAWPPPDELLLLFHAEREDLRMRIGIAEEGAVQETERLSLVLSTYQVNSMKTVLAMSRHAVLLNETILNINSINYDLAYNEVSNQFGIKAGYY